MQSTAFKMFSYALTFGIGMKAAPYWRTKGSKMDNPNTPGVPGDDATWKSTVLEVGAHAM